MTNIGPLVSKHDDVTVITMGPSYDSFDDERLENLKEVVFDIVQTADPPRVVIDMSQTTFFASSFIAVLNQGVKKMKARENGKIVVSGLTKFAAEVFSVARLDRVWDIYPTREEAVRALCN